MPTLKIVPLSMPQSITHEAYKTITSNTDARIFLQTEHHPSAKFIVDENITHVSMDDIYDEVYDFDELNKSIAQRLICGENAIYAVCGRGVAEPLMKCILECAEVNGTDVEILPASGYAEAAAASCGFSMSGCALHSAHALPREADTACPLCIEEIDNPITAGEVKLFLSEFYPEGDDILFAYTDVEGAYTVRSIKLYELDRQKEYFATTVVLIRPYSFGETDRYGLQGLEEVVRILRAPNGCPWDRKQTHESLKSALIEESYEVLDAIDNDDVDALCEELGDLLLQIVFHAELENEKSCFTMRDVCTGIVKKLIFRHPHVFAGADGIKTADDVLAAWSELKKEEKHQTTQGDTLKAVPRSLPALMRSAKLQKRAAEVGFDWDSAKSAMFKIDEEKAEVESAMESDNDENLKEEVGDLLFAVVNVARLLKINPELALADSCDKFMERFCKMEELILKDNKNLKDMSLDEMDEYWEMCKKVLKKSYS